MMPAPASAGVSFCGDFKLTRGGNVLPHVPAPRLALRAEGPSALVRCR